MKSLNYRYLIGTNIYNSTLYGTHTGNNLTLKGYKIQHITPRGENNGR
jgi:hypothetical protein